MVYNLKIGVNNLDIICISVGDPIFKRGMVGVHKQV